jgi:hypothetical protein
MIFAGQQGDCGYYLWRGHDHKSLDGDEGGCSLRGTSQGMLQAGFLYRIQEALSSVLLNGRSWGSGAIWSFELDIIASVCGGGIGSRRNDYSDFTSNMPPYSGGPFLLDIG